MNVGDREYLICQKHNAFSYRADDECNECKIAQLEAENARLREELAVTKADAAAGWNKCEERRLEAEAAQLDAKRYRWLRIQDRDDLSFAVLEGAHWRGAGDCDPYFFDNSEELDAAIDEAMKENEK